MVTWQVNGGHCLGGIKCLPLYEMGSSEGVSPRFGILRLSYVLLVGFSCDSVLLCSHSTLRLSQCGTCPFQNELFIHLDLMSAVRQVVSGARCCL